MPVEMNPGSKFCSKCGAGREYAAESADSLARIAASVDAIRSMISNYFIAMLIVGIVLLLCSALECSLRVGVPLT
jgi:hypothetical protein